MENIKRYVSVQLLHILIAYASSSRYDLDAILKKSGINQAELSDEDTKLDLDRFCSVVSILESMAGETLSGLKLAQGVDAYSKNHLLMSIMSHCSTLDKAIDKLIQYHDISSNSIKLHKENHNGLIAVVWSVDMLVVSNMERILVEAAMASCALMFRHFTLGRAAFAEVHFMYPSQENQAEYCNFFGCPTLFNKKDNRLLFTRDTLSLPMVLSDPDFLVILENYADVILSKENRSNLLSERIVRYLEEMILQGMNYQIRNVADKMAVSVRTLQKQLAQENITYRELLEKVKKNIMFKSLAHGRLPLTDIAFLLGFSEQSAFNHAFKRWTGQSPKKFMENNTTETFAVENTLLS